MTDGKIEIKNGMGYQRIDNGGVVYEYKDGNLEITTSFFGYGSTTLVIPFLTKKNLLSIFKVCNKTYSREINSLRRNYEIYCRTYREAIRSAC